MYPGELPGPRGCGVWGCAIEVLILAGMKPSEEDLVGAGGLWLCFPAYKGFSPPDITKTRLTFSYNLSAAKNVGEQSFGCPVSVHPLLWAPAWGAWKGLLCACSTWAS